MTLDDEAMAGLELELGRRLGCGFEATLALVFVEGHGRILLRFTTENTEVHRGNMVRLQSYTCKEKILQLLWLELVR